MTDSKYFYILIGLVVLLLGTTVFLFHKTRVLEDKYQTLGHYVNERIACKCYTNEEIAVQQFKEDSYIRQREHDTNLILLVFGLIVGAITFFTYTTSESKLHAIRSEVDDKIKGQEAKYNETQKTIDRLQNELQHETYFIKMEDAKQYKKTGTIAGYVYYALSALGYLAQSHIGYYNSGNEELAESYLDSLKSDLKDIDSALTKQEVMGNITKSMVDTTFRIILKVDDEEVKELLYSISLKLKFDS